MKHLLFFFLFLFNSTVCFSCRERKFSRKKKVWNMCYNSENEQVVDIIWRELLNRVLRSLGYLMVILCESMPSFYYDSIEIFLTNFALFLFFFFHFVKYLIFFFSMKLFALIFSFIKWIEYINMVNMLIDAVELKWQSDGKFQTSVCLLASLECDTNFPMNKFEQKTSEISTRFVIVIQHLFLFLLLIDFIQCTWQKKK